MNAAQARAVARLVEALQHPAKDIYGYEYEPGETCEADVIVGRREVAGGAEVVQVEFAVPAPTLAWFDVVDGVSFRHAGRCELGVTAMGTFVLWSTLRVPPGDWDVEMCTEAALREAAGDVPAVFELDCWRRVGYRWAPDDLGKTLRWAFRLDVGSPLVDPLPEWRAARDQAAAARLAA